MRNQNNIMFPAPPPNLFDISVVTKARITKFLSVQNLDKIYYRNNMSGKDSNV